MANVKFVKLPWSLHCDLWSSCTLDCHGRFILVYHPGNLGIKAAYIHHVWVWMMWFCMAENVSVTCASNFSAFCT